MARPEPSKIRPSMSSDTPSFKLSPVSSTRVYFAVSVRRDPDTTICLTFFTSMPEVPSKTCVLVQ